MVGCLSCSYRTPRHSFQSVLSELNPDLSEKPTQTMAVRPDGDVDLSAEEVNLFRVPNCPKCSTGILKPIIVFFGDNVPKQKVAFTRQLVIKNSFVKICKNKIQLLNTLFNLFHIKTQDDKIERSFICF
jgi:NAD-dependent SIR2 family protein deacetylase